MVSIQSHIQRNLVVELYCVIKIISKAAEFPDSWLRNGHEYDLERFFIPDDRRLKRGND